MIIVCVINKQKVCLVVEKCLSLRLYLVLDLSSLVAITVMYLGTKVKRMLLSFRFYMIFLNYLAQLFCSLWESNQKVMSCNLLPFKNAINFPISSLGK